MIFWFFFWKHHFGDFLYFNRQTHVFYKQLKSNFLWTFFTGKILLLFSFSCVQNRAAMKVTSLTFKWKSHIAGNSLPTHISWWNIVHSIKYIIPNINFLLQAFSRSKWFLCADGIEIFFWIDVTRLKFYV